MKTKRKYLIEPLKEGHPFYSERATIYEITIQEGNDYALIYQEILPHENVLYLIENLDELSWDTLDRLTYFWMKVTPYYREKSPWLT